MGKSKKPKIREWYYDTFRTYIHFCMGIDYISYCQYLHSKSGKLNKINKIPGGITQLSMIDGRPHIFIWVPDKKEYSHIAHESLHATNFIFQHIGHETNQENDEVQAYVMMHIMEEAMK